MHLNITRLKRFAVSTFWLNLSLEKGIGWNRCVINLNNSRTSSRKVCVTECEREQMLPSLETKRDSRPERL